ncbi:MAG: HDOD domain-containing protein [Planctomycetota bacterium]
MNAELDSSPTSPPKEFEFQLPPFPVTATQLVTEINRDQVEVPKITQLIECDPVISSKVLALANSPIYCPSRPIATINHAVVILGFRSVSKLVLTIATSSVFADKNTPCLDARLRTLKESLAVATAARLVAERTGSVNADEAFLAGVMHDVGKLVLFNAAGEEYDELLKRHPGGNSTAEERERFGATHPQLGSNCGASWGVPHDINIAISNHHESLNDVQDPLARMIVQAEVLARRWQVGFEGASPEAEDETLEDAVAPFVADEELHRETLEQFEAISQLCLG